MYVCIFKNSMCGFPVMVMANVHLHHLTAKKETGFSDAHEHFWETLAKAILQHEVRVLAGDFNMSLLCVVPELRKRGVQVNIAACFPWICSNDNTTRLDSCGLFIIGGASSIKLKSCPSVFSDPVPSTVVDDTSAVADVQGEPGLQSFNAGQGYPLTSYLPKGKGVEKQMEAVEETLRCDFSVSVQGPLFPPCKEKRANTVVFDPKGNLFTMGVHMPLLVFMGDKSRRSPEALQRRELKAREKGVHFGTGKGKGKSKDKDKGKEGKPYTVVEGKGK